MLRMLTQPQSLLARVYKSQYFLKIDPLNAPLGLRPSFAWKSIHGAQSLLKEGIRMQVGNGEDIRVWKDEWIGSKPV